MQASKDLETRFMGLTRRLKSSYSICAPSGELRDLEVSRAQFYFAVRSIIYKQTKGESPDAEIMNLKVEAMVQEAILFTGIENIVDEEKSIDLYKDNTLSVAVSYRSVDLYELNDESINIYDYDNSELVLVDKYLPSALKGYNVRVIDTNYRQTSNERLQRNSHKINKLKQGTKNQIMYKI